MVASGDQGSEPTQAPSAAAPSPFPPIADYAFLSDCHTGALVAPDGSIDWLCVPCFDAPSVFASLLDREAGSFRFGPFGLSVPTASVYEPGTNTLVTTWHTPTGWAIVRDALVMGPRHDEDVITPHTRPPADDDDDHMLVRSVLCLEGKGECDNVAGIDRLLGELRGRGLEVPMHVDAASGGSCSPSRSRTHEAITDLRKRAAGEHTRKASAPRARVLDEL